MPSEITVSNMPKETTPSFRLLLPDSAEKQTIVSMMLTSSAAAMTSAGRAIGVPTALPEAEWTSLRDQVRERLASFRRALGNPVSLTNDGQIHLSEYAMIPERPYVIEYAGSTYEFIRMADGSIVISEVRLAE